MRASLLWVGCGLLLFIGCAAQQPAISDIRQDVVKVQGEPMLVDAFGFAHVREKNEQNLQVVKAEAERGCQIYERGGLKHALGPLCAVRPGVCEWGLRP